jgi:hypothetical protein
MPPRNLLLVIVATAVLSAGGTAAVMELTTPPEASAGSSDVAVLRQIRSATRMIEADIGSQPGTSLLGEVQDIQLKLAAIYARQAFVCRATTDRAFDCPSPVP